MVFPMSWAGVRAQVLIALVQYASSQLHERVEDKKAHHEVESGPGRWAERFVATQFEESSPIYSRCTDTTYDHVD